MKRKKWCEFSITLCIKSNVLNVNVPKTVTMIAVEIDQNQNNLAKLEWNLLFFDTKNKKETGKNIDEKAETYSHCPMLLPLTNPCWDISLD